MDPGGGTSSAPLRSMAVGADVLVVVRGGTGAGMAGLVHDADAVLTQVVSPTVLDPADLLLGWAVGLLVAVLLFLLGRLLWARIGPVALPDDEDLEPVEEA